MKTVFLLFFVFVSGCISPERLPSEPGQLFLHAGENESFVYLNHKISISYQASFPAHKIELVIDGEKEVIDISLNAACPGGTCFYSGKKGDVTYIIQPVTWENKTWSFASWNTSEIYFRVIKG